ncbi:uncharacterized protein LOC133532840 [Cydia pomonella]|uniref:uncharacterized protein LOC133532840 n=1 Tax=Cydia pomonella TaxID=82600 RepID=UPI002ADDE508|nr:uncharacterized protein LOC133532840 [Cydia pomonella]
MFNAVKESLENLSLTFENVCGFSADNTNANFGARHSLFTNIRDEVPDVLKGNCHAHIIHNCVKRAMDFLSYDVENVILKIYSHFAHSAVRREELKKIVEAVDGNFHELKRHVGTRWLSLLPCVDTVLINWTAIRNYFVSLGEDCPMIIQNLLLLNSSEDLIEVYLNFCSHILNVFSKTIKSLEGDSITVLDVFNIMTNIKKDLLKRKEDKFYGFMTMQKIESLEQSSPGQKNKICKNFDLFIYKAVSYLETWFNFDNDNWLAIISHFDLNSALSFQQIFKIVEMLNMQSKLDMDCLYTEVNLLNDVREKIYNSSFKDFCTAKKWESIFSQETVFPNIFKVRGLW